jgi:transcriptional regulator with XRE-family HTH domain
MYPTLHEADINKFVSIVDELLTESKNISETNLSRLRKARGLSQKELSDASGVALRMIQLYEQRQNDINKAQAASLHSLAQALGCKIEDLFQ